MLSSGIINTQSKIFRFVRGWCLLGIYSVVIGGNLLTPLSVYASDPAVKGAMEDLYSDDRYQKELPLDIKDAKVETKELPPPKLKKEELPEDVDLSALVFLGKILLFGFIALVAVLLGKAIFNYLRDLKRRPQRKIVSENKPASYSRVTNMPEELSEETLEYADDLARKGQFEAAIRALLFCCLKHVRESYHATLPAALTNREILQADWLPSDVRQKLSVIVNAEELTEFGGRSAGAQEFGICREAFHIFVKPKGFSRTSTEGSAV